MSKGKLPASPRNESLRRTSLRVLRALSRYEKAGCNSKDLARDCKLPLRTVQFHLKSLVRDDVIVERGRGHFVYVSGVADILADPGGQEGLHGLVLSTMKLREPLLRMPLLRQFPSLSMVSPGRRWGEVSMDWAGHVVAIRYFPGTHRLLIYVPSTRKPIRFGAFGEFAGWLSGVLYPLAPEDFEVKQVGVHTDYGGWMLKGVQAVELRRFLNASEQLYQKVGAVRHEVHVVPKDLSLDRAVRIVREGSPTAQLERLLQLQLQVIEREATLSRPPEQRATPPLRDLQGAGYG